MSDYLKISIVTPSLNQAEYLEYTIQSVLEQDYPNLEYIIVDGGSTDGSQKIIENYQENLHYWVSEPDANMYEALTKGFEQSTGQIMGWINSDDKYHPGAFEIINDIFRTLNKVNWIQGTPNHFDEKGRCVSVFPLRNWSKYDYYCKDFQWIQQESTFWRRSLWEKAGSRLSSKLRFAGDLELWMRFFRYEKLYSYPALTGGFRIRSGNQISYDMKEPYMQEAYEIIQKEISLLNASTLQTLTRIRRLQRLQEICCKLRIASFSRRCGKRIRMLKEYPPPIFFERISQTFRI